MKTYIQIHSEIIKKTDKKKWNCMCNDCSEIAINSHVLQKNGIIKEISEDNHLYERVKANIFKIQDKGSVEFKRRGINEVYTFKGFCQKHDTEIFKEIEKEETNLFKVRDQSLFCYRGL